MINIAFLNEKEISKEKIKAVRYNFECNKIIHNAIRKSYSSIIQLQWDTYRCKWSFHSSSGAENEVIDIAQMPGYFYLMLGRFYFFIYSSPGHSCFVSTRRAPTACRFSILRNMSQTCVLPLFILVFTVNSFQLFKYNIGYGMNASFTQCHKWINALPFPHCSILKSISNWWWTICLSSYFRFSREISKFLLYTKIIIGKMCWKCLENKALCSVLHPNL